MVKVAILGTGLVGSDLLTKVMRSPYLECVMFSGQRDDSPGIMRAKKLGIPTSTKSINGIPNQAKIVFDCTNAKSHMEEAGIFHEMDKRIIDLTPSRIGKMCIPNINLKECLNEWEVSLVTCGGQAMCYTAKKIMEQHPEIDYMELVSTIASKSAGIGTRENIDEYIETTTKALQELSGVKKAKVILIINQADIEMRNTLTYMLNGKRESITKMVKTEGGLPGNLELITRAAIEVAEGYAKN